MACISDFLNLRLIAPAVFKFGDVGKPCTYWSDGEHIVAEGFCRCGKQFNIYQT